MARAAAHELEKTATAEDVAGTEIRRRAHVERCHRQPAPRFFSVVVRPDERLEPAALIGIE